MNNGSSKLRILGMIVCLTLVCVTFFSGFPVLKETPVLETRVGGQGPGNANWTFVANYTNGMYTGIDVGDDANPDFADMDNDGDLDLVVGNYNGTLWFYNNTGTIVSFPFKQ